MRLSGLWMVTIGTLCLTGCGSEVPSRTHDYIPGEKVNEKKTDVSWPPYPWQTFESGDYTSHAGEAFLGLRIGMFDTYASLSAKTSFSFDVLYKTLVVKHKNTPGTRLFRENGSFNFDGDEPLVARCTYKTEASAKGGVDSYLNIMGSGGGYRLNKNKNIEVETSSSLFEIGRQQNLTGVQQLCKNIFDEQLKKSVLADLKAAIKSNVFLNDHPSHQVRAILAAIHGPERLVRIDGYTFLVSKAEVLQQNGDIWLKGKISSRRFGILKEYEYVFDYVAGKLEYFSYETGLSKRSQVAQKIILLIKNNLLQRLKGGPADLILDTSLKDSGCALPPGFPNTYEMPSLDGLKEKGAG